MTIPFYADADQLSKPWGLRDVGLISILSLMSGGAVVLGYFNASAEISILLRGVAGASVILGTFLLLVVALSGISRADEYVRSEYQKSGWHGAIWVMFYVMVMMVLTNLGWLGVLNDNISQVELFWMMPCLMAIYTYVVVRVKFKTLASLAI
ncbi:MAG: hypothetical protein COA69_07305 [Robiginitomaculum sp.]|nr:MAG: hypothetical protein COA69_07305 [Robiginitomaculum sp.]